MKKELVFCLLVVFLVGFVSAGFQVGNLSHTLTQTAYAPGGIIEGWINISLDNEPANTLFSDLRGNSISLIDLLETSLNSNVNYECSTTGCVSDYTATNEENSTNFSLNAGTSKILGIKITQSLDSIINVSFVVQSDAQESCTNQLQIDFLNDGTIEKGNNKSTTNQYCVANSGCFDNSEPVSEYIIGTIGLGSSKHCQRFNLTESPGFKLGAWVRGNGDTRTLQMGLYKLGGDFLGECDLPLGDRSVAQTLSCDVDYLVTEQEEAYVCIYGESEGEAEVRGYNAGSEGCGFYSNYFGGAEDYAFDIFIEGKKFDSIGTLEITNSLANGNFLSDLMQDYISSTYSEQCSITNPCYVPINFTSNADQQITINQIDIELDTGGGETSITTFFDFTETPARISSGFEKIFLDKGNFSVGQEYGNETFSLRLEESSIFSENISVERVPVILSLTPTSTAYGFPTEFIVNVNSSSNITHYSWQFGTTTIIETTSTNKITHTYNSSGQYTITVSITDEFQRTALRTFSINVTNPKEKINQTLSEMQHNLANIKIQIERFTLYDQERLNSYLDLTNTEAILTELQRNFTQANSDTEYYRIIGALFSLNIPESISKTKSATSLLYYANENLIDINAVGLITGESSSRNQEQQYIDAILSWNHQNLDTRISLSEFSVKQGSYFEHLLNVFELDIQEKDFLEENPYLIFGNLQDLSFKSGTGEENISGFKYVEIMGSQKIVFSTTENIRMANLPVFISPALNKLNLNDGTDSTEKKSKWVLFALIFGVLVVVGIIVYVAMQIWYKKKYESYLFPNKNNLYNLITYANNAKRQGTANKDIISNLKKVQWSSEQISYVMKKLAGKRTGMYELPVGKIFKKKQAPKPGPGSFPQKKFFPRRRFTRRPH